MTDAQRCTCACHWLNKKPPPAPRFTHTTARACCKQALIRPRLSVTIHYDKPTITVTTRPDA